MKTFFEKHEISITIFWIILYIVSNSFCMQNWGLTDYRTSILNFTLVGFILIFIFQNKLGEYYGLTKLPKCKEFLYFIPLLCIVSVNLWNGIHIHNSTTEIIFFIATMIAVGFLEEIIFRGFLFKMMEKDNVHRAILVSSLTFGMGHIINLFNGAEIIPTLIQVSYSIAAGYMFVIIFQKGKSLWPCIITHSAINAVSIFHIDTTVSFYIEPIFLILVSISYAIYLQHTMK